MAKLCRGLFGEILRYWTFSVYCKRAQKKVQSYHDSCGPYFVWHEHGLVSFKSDEYSFASLRFVHDFKVIFQLLPSFKINRELK